MNGHFIVFEGGEGSGKSRHSKYVAEELRKEGYDVFHTFEPGGSEICQLIRKIILHEGEEKLSSRAELMLFLADRAQHIDCVIKPALKAGKVVICDRFSGSTFAYQIGGRQLEKNAQMIQKMDVFVRAGIRPDLVMYLDIDPEIGIQRKLEGEEQINRLDKEEIDFHKRVHAYFLQMVKQNDHWRSCSTEGPKEKNSEHILEAIKQATQL